MEVTKYLAKFATEFLIYGYMYKIDSLLKKITSTSNEGNLRFYKRNLPLTKQSINEGYFTTQKNYRRIAVIIAVDVFINNGEFEHYKADFDIAKAMLRRSPNIRPEKISNMLCDIHHDVRQYLKILGIAVEIPKREL